MGYRILGALAFILTGCGTDLKQPDDGWDERLIPIVRRFTQDAESYGLPGGRLGMVAQIRESDEKLAANQDPEDSLVGVCVIKSMKRTREWRGEIYISEGLDYTSLREVLYHELTHCVYGMEHWGVVGDIQYPLQFSGVFDWEEAKRRHFTELKARVSE